MDASDRRNGWQGLETPAAAGCRVLAHTSALHPSKDEGAGARDTASIALQVPPERVTSSGFETNEF